MLSADVLIVQNSMKKCREKSRANGYSKRNGCLHLVANSESNFNHYIVVDTIGLETGRLLEPYSEIPFAGETANERPCETRSVRGEKNERLEIDLRYASFCKLFSRVPPD